MKNIAVVKYATFLADHMPSQWLRVLYQWNSQDQSQSVGIMLYAKHGTAVYCAKLRLNSTSLVWLICKMQQTILSK